MEAKFSLTSIALGNLRRRRGRYLLLIAGIVLAIYFVATALLFADTMFVSLRERHYNRQGEQDAIVFDCGEAPLEELISRGIFSEYGTAGILGCVLPDGQEQENGFSIARFDEAALALARQEPLEGRLPEKAGEIALERSALARLRSSAGVGDKITLTLLVPDGSGFMEKPIQKSYTLVGILADKQIYLDRWNSATPAYRDYPAGVLSTNEQIEPGGRAVINCYGRYAGNAAAAFERLREFCLENKLVTEHDWPNLEQTRYRLFDAGEGADEDIMITSTFLAIIALVLVCAACLGIVNAFSADLEARRRQIGLLRAVGATQKQIRTIFGREVTLIALCSIPTGLVLAALTVRGITVLLGKSFIFRPNLLIILAIAAAGVICVRLAAAIPLRKAGRIPPMQAIRNVELTRRLKRSRVQSRPLFDVPRHLARRNMTLYRGRQAGITAMLAASIVLLSFAAFGARPILSEAGWDYRWDYVLGKQSRTSDWLMEYELHRPGITEQDRAEAAALAGVKTVVGEKLLQVKILTDKITPYIINSNFWRFDYLSPEPQQDDHPHERQWQLQQFQDYLASKDKYGYRQDYLTVDCCGIDAAVIEKLHPFVSAGRINIDKLNSGEEILVVAPAEYGFVEEKLDDGSTHSYYDYTLDSNTAYSAVHQNDMFRAGDAITVSLLYCNSPEAQEYNEDGSRKLPDDAVRIDRAVTVGALLEPEAGDKYLSDYFPGSFFCQAGNIITTVAGLNSLGFDTPYTILAIALYESPDPAMEEYLETNLGWIAARTAGVELRSYVAMTRESRQIAYGLLIAAGAILLLFFAICASMINNALSARIRAGRREIGTLRAVGASEQVITRSYLWQLLATFSWGTIIGLAMELALCGWMLTQEHIAAGAATLPLWEPLLFVALLFGICLLNVRSKVGAIFKDSIVENIREL
ncbi:MAG TPA: FtsX-like permease family protein [Bacillota bacterium]|nr:FtsX-like permease family protein [Bacillota bacterium]